MDAFLDPIDIRREKQKARDLRKTQWWRQKCSRGVCYYCRNHFPAHALTMDHIVPLARGGRSTKNNLVTACKECNNQKKYLLPMEWKEYIEGDRIGDCHEM